MDEPVFFALLQEVCKQSGDELFRGLEIAADFAEENGIPNAEALRWAAAEKRMPSRWHSAEPCWDWWHAGHPGRESSWLPRKMFLADGEDLRVGYREVEYGYAESPTAAEAYLWLMERWPLFDGSGADEKTA